MLMMSVVFSSEFRNRKNKTEMQPQTTDFASYHYPASQMQLLDRSPTATPIQTRSGSPTRGMVIPHTVEETTNFMNRLNDLMGPSLSLEPNAAEKPASSNKPIAFTEPDEKVVLKSVSTTDGSATVATSTKVKYLIIYFAFNLGLTLFNKAVMIAVCVCADLSFVLFLDFIFGRDFVKQEMCCRIVCGVHGGQTLTLRNPRHNLILTMYDFDRIATRTDLTP